MNINNEAEFCKVVKTMLNENRITQEEYDTLTDYICGIFDGLDGMGLEEEDLF